MRKSFGKKNIKKFKKSAGMFFSSSSMAIQQGSNGYGVLLEGVTNVVFERNGRITVTINDDSEKWLTRKNHQKAREMIFQAIKKSALAARKKLMLIEGCLVINFSQDYDFNRVTRLEQGIEAIARTEGIFASTQNVNELIKRKNGLNK